MADQETSAVVPPQQDVRRTSTPSGVIHVRTYQSGQYVIVGNHLAQHHDLSLTAIGLATHIFSVPEGTPVDIRTLAERFPEGRDRIAFALRELEAHGYLERVREHTESGRLVTRTYAHHTPDAARVAVPAAPAPLRPASGRTAQVRGGGSRVSGGGRSGAGGALPGGRSGEGGALAGSRSGEGLAGGRPGEGGAVPEGPQEDDQGGGAGEDSGTARTSGADAADGVVGVVGVVGSARAVGGPVQPVPAGQGEQGGRLYEEAVALLAGLRRVDERVILSMRDVRWLAPKVVRWFERGATPAAVQRTLLADLPPRMWYPGGVLDYRLRTSLPPSLPAAPVPASGAPAGTARPHPFQDCDGCGRVFRAPEPGSCLDCRTEAGAGAACPAAAAVGEPVGGGSGAGVPRRGERAA
ncbi:helix-turn-helix domain-containing protein [Streptomyces fradiae]|uniref:helix-turn-helix domain-containing protein n=1 Tax=Streptomyces fradiae TaxID=1906 RepID=UPI002942CFD4|nr:helix-turn-helix domain-containing protein [Streptomyces fradiae]WOI63100.1 helix-turn-helix domain-containing protein [Streptomyces fradiae]